MSNYRPWHAPGCPARDPKVSPERLRLRDDRTVEAVRICTCPPERFGPGSEPIWEPGDPEVTEKAVRDQLGGEGP